MSARLRVPGQLLLQPVHLHVPTGGASHDSTLSTHDGTAGGSTAVAQDVLQSIPLASYPFGHPATVSRQGSNAQQPDTLRQDSRRVFESPVEFWWISAEGLTNGHNESSPASLLQGSRSHTTREGGGATQLQRLRSAQEHHQHTYQSPRQARIRPACSEAAPSSRWSSSSWSSSALEQHGEELIRAPWTYAGDERRAFQMTRDGSSDGDEADPSRTSRLRDRAFTGSRRRDDLEPTTTDINEGTDSSSSRGSSETLSSGYPESCNSLRVPSASVLSIAASNSISPLNLPPATTGVVPHNAFVPAFLLEHDNASLMSLLSTAAYDEQGSPSAESSEYNWLDMTSSVTSSNRRSRSSVRSDSSSSDEGSGESIGSAGDGEEGLDAQTDVCTSRIAWHPAPAHLDYHDQLTCGTNGVSSGLIFANEAENLRVAPQLRTTTTYDVLNLIDMYRVMQASAIEAVPVGDNDEILAEWMQQSRRLAKSSEPHLYDRCQSTTPQPRKCHGPQPVHSMGTKNDSDVDCRPPEISNETFADYKHQKQATEAGKAEARSLLSSLLPRLQGSPTKSRLLSTLQKKTSAASEVPFAPDLPVKIYFEDRAKHTRASGTRMSRSSLSSSSKVPSNGTALASSAELEVGKVKRRWYESKEYTRPNADVNPKSATVIIGAGTGKCTVAALGIQGTQRTSASEDPVGKQSDGSVVSLNRFLAESGLTRETTKQASLDEEQDESRTPTPTQASLGFDRNMGHAPKWSSVTNMESTALAAVTPAANLDRRGGASVVRNARGLEAGQVKPLLLGLCSGVSPRDSAQRQSTRSLKPAQEPRSFENYNSVMPRCSSQPKRRDAALTVHLFPMPPPLRPTFGTRGQANANTRANLGGCLSYEEHQEGVCDAANQDGHYEEEAEEVKGLNDVEDNDDGTDVFSQARLSEAESFSKRQGLAMSIVLEEEEEEEEEEGPEVGSAFDTVQERLGRNAGVKGTR